MKQSILQMENHIYMVKYGELVNAQAGVQIQVDPCMNGDVMTDRLSLLSHAFLSIPKESPYILKFPENLLGTRKSRFENFDKFREIIMGFFFGKFKISKRYNDAV